MQQPSESSGITKQQELYFSILIPSWNNLPYLKCCIQSIQKHSVFPHQIIVHVNEGNDGTREWLDKMQIAYTLSSENIGICKAMNQSAKLAASDYLLFLNDDMYVLPGWDKALMDAALQYPDHRFYLSGTLIEPVSSGNKCAIAPFDFGRTPDALQEEELLNTYSSISWHDWYGATWPPSLVHRIYWNKVGGYSEAFSPGLYSDPDFSMKLWRIGIRVFRGVGASRVYHFMSRTTARIPMNNGHRQFVKKWQMTARYFTQHILKMGKRFEGKPLQGHDECKASFWHRLRLRLPLTM